LSPNLHQFLPMTSSPLRRHVLGTPASDSTFKISLAQQQISFAFSLVWLFGTTELP